MPLRWGRPSDRRTRNVSHSRLVMRQLIRPSLPFWPERWWEWLDLHQHDPCGLRLMKPLPCLSSHTPMKNGASRGSCTLTRSLEGYCAELLNTSDALKSGGMYRCCPGCLRRDRTASLLFFLHPENTRPRFGFHDKGSFLIAARVLK